MFDREFKVYAFLLDYGRSLAADIDDARFAEQPAPGLNPPAWQFAHLATTADMALALLGERPTLAEDWRATFGPGSKPSADRSSYPPKEELLGLWGEAHARFAAAASDASDRRLEHPNPLKIAPIVRAFPTVGDLVAHLLTSHEAMHLGQLSSWRRQVGLPYLF